MKELAQLQKEKNDWRCNTWLEAATGRSTVLAATPGNAPPRRKFLVLHKASMSDLGSMLSRGGPLAAPSGSIARHCSSV